MLRLLMVLLNTIKTGFEDKQQIISRTINFQLLYRNGTIALKVCHDGIILKCTGNDLEFVYGWPRKWSWNDLDLAYISSQQNAHTQECTKMSTARSVVSRFEYWRDIMYFLSSKGLKLTDKFSHGCLSNQDLLSHNVERSPNMERSHR